MSLESHKTDWIVQVNESLNALPSLEQQQWKTRSIYRVPPHVAHHNRDAYLPQVVSFGPYHHGHGHLRPMEEHKRRALTHFLKRSGKRCEPFLDSLRGVAQELEESYDVLDPKWKESRQFLELMITDGCFMLEIMRMTVRVVENDYADNDPIFSPDRLADIWPSIRRDMLKLENQLPMLVLEHLVAVERGDKAREVCIHRLILSYHGLDQSVSGTHRFLHVMDVCRKGLLASEKKVTYGPEDGDHMIIRSATELNQAGIRFKKSDTGSPTDISFDRGVLSLPVITVDEATKSMYLNIMNFERLHIGTGTEVTSYVIFMDCIINDKQDVELLHAQGIIQNAFGSDKDVANLFNSMCKEVTFASNRNLDAVRKNISRHCEKRRNEWRANLNRTYFKNPWTILSLIAAISLFALTLIQTVYAALCYY